MAEIFPGPGRSSKTSIRSCTDRDEDFFHSSRNSDVLRRHSTDFRAQGERIEYSCSRCPRPRFLHTCRCQLIRFCSLQMADISGALLGTLIFFGIGIVGMILVAIFSKERRYRIHLCAMETSDTLLRMHILWWWMAIIQMWMMYIFAFI